MSVITCNDLPSHVRDLCPEYKNSGILSVAIIFTDHTVTDWTSASQWATNINNGKIEIVEGIKGALPAPTPVTVDNPLGCGADQIVVSYDYEFSWTDANVSTFNDAFYEELNNTVSYFAFYYCHEDEIRVVDASEVTYQATPPESPEAKELQKYTVTASWNSKKNVFPNLYDAPGTIFTNT